MIRVEVAVENFPSPATSTIKIGSGALAERISPERGTKKK
jgi:hypothetical protein